jgi:hypothetical protein
VVVITLATVALAEPFHVDVLALPATAHTPSVRAYSETIAVDGRTVETPLEPITRGFGHRGAQLEIGRCWDDDAQWIAAVGYRQANPTYTMGAIEFHPTVRELNLQVGFLAFASASPVARPVGLYVAGYTGAQFSAFSSAPFDPTVVTPGWLSSLAVGVATRNTPVRIRVEGRLEMNPRFDRFTGSAQLVENAFVWTHFPGSATASVLIGLGYASPRREVEVAVPAVVWQSAEPGEGP